MKHGDFKRQAMAEIKEQITADHYRFCKLVVSSVFERSPIWTGAYIGSHRVTMPGLATSPAEARPPEIKMLNTLGVEEVWAPPEHSDPIGKMLSEKKAQLAKLARLFRISRGPMLRHIKIINEAHDAALVEFRGTTTGGHTYMRVAATWKGWRAPARKAKVEF